MNYKGSKPPTCTCFGYSCDHLQGGVIKTICYKYLKNQRKIVKYKLLKCMV